MAVQSVLMHMDVLEQTGGEPLAYRIKVRSTQHVADLGREGNTSAESLSMWIGKLTASDSTILSGHLILVERALAFGVVSGTWP